ncbi:uncharacterized protein LOC124288182 [Haliotis rubra]|uniref:uncharacterized protein LOC124288182 n=1 Tax=Haliotis rubra TaxID=36100 RepID=UPI001EE4FD08|nr:uncharacterized protein LOC124288182 [Haliotis rubra]
MLPRDRLHVVALMLTALASIFQCVGVLFPNWWVLKDTSTKNVVATFSLFGPVRCSDNLCFPEDVRVISVPEGMTPPSAVPNDNAAWLTVGRILSVVGVTLVLATVVLQLIFLKASYRALQLVANSFLVTAATVSFITGFFFIFKFVTLTEAYVNLRPLGADTYPAAPGCILFSGVICAVAALFTTLAFKPPRKAAILI